MYTLLAKEFPFVADKEERLFELIKKGEVNFERPRLKNVSKSGKFIIFQDRLRTVLSIYAKHSRIVLE